MRYIGSKTSTLPWLTETFAAKAPDARSLCDPFAGTCVVPRHFKHLGMTVVTGDVLHLSHVLQQATIGIDEAPAFEGLARHGLTFSQGTAAEATLLHLQQLPGRPGYMHGHFSDAGTADRRFFTAENAARIDAVRTTIADWRSRDMLDDGEEAFLLASLVDAADRVANTAGTYYAHLKAFTKKALRPLELRLPGTTRNGASGGCHRVDAAELAARTETDILYLDPPYNERNYSRYYHLPETLVRGDAPAARGRSGVPDRCETVSEFYRRAQAGTALARICSAAPARNIVVHYTSQGIIPHQAILDALALRGEVTHEDREVRAYSSHKGRDGAVARHRLYWCRVTKGVN